MRKFIGFIKWSAVAFGAFIIFAVVFDFTFRVGDPEGYKQFQAEIEQRRVERLAVAAEKKRFEAVPAPVVEEPKRMSRKLAADICETMTRQVMKDPNSFELISWAVNRSDDAQVLINYRATNSFGGYMRGQSGCDIYTSGNVKLAFVN